MYFRDLTSYQYCLPFPLHGILNVGWLSPEHSYTKGVVDAGSISEIKFLAIYAAAHVMRGYHYCEFCGCEPPRIKIGNDMLELGFAELLVRDEGGRMYAAPNLLVHYIETHNYRPPDAFFEAARWTVEHISEWNADEVYEIAVDRGFAEQ